MQRSQYKARGAVNALPYRNKPLPPLPSLEKTENQQAGSRDSISTSSLIEDVSPSLSEHLNSRLELLVDQTNKLLARLYAIRAREAHALALLGDGMYKVPPAHADILQKLRQKLDRVSKGERVAVYCALKNGLEPGEKKILRRAVVGSLRVDMKTEAREGPKILDAVAECPGHTACAMVDTSDCVDWDQVDGRVRRSTTSASCCHPRPGVNEVDVLAADDAYVPASRDSVQKSRPAIDKDVLDIRPQPLHWRKSENPDRDGSKRQGSVAVARRKAEEALRTHNALAEDGLPTRAPRVVEEPHPELNGENVIKIARMKAEMWLREAARISR